jgi:hypothetical protein
VSTSERDATGHILIVGDTGFAFITAETNDCPLSEAPCQAQVFSEFHNSDGSVVSPAQSVAQTPAQVSMVGKAPGFARLTAQAAGLVATDSVTVVAGPVPVDSIWARSYGSAYDSVIDIVEDPAGSVSSVTLPVQGSVFIELIAFRYDRAVTLPWTVISNDAAVAWASLGCRAPLVDPGCTVYGTSWITGLSPGTTTVSVTARNIQHSISVTVE